MRFLLIILCALPSRAAEMHFGSPKEGARTRVFAPYPVSTPDFSVPLSDTGLGFTPERWTGFPSLARGNAVALTLEGSPADRRTVGYYRSREEAVAVLGEHAQGSQPVSPVDKSAIRIDPNDSLAAQQLNRVADTGIFDSLPDQVYRADLTSLMPPVAAAMAGRRGRKNANCFNAVECAVGLSQAMGNRANYMFSSALESAGYVPTRDPHPGDVGLLFEAMGALEHAFLVVLTGTDAASHWAFTKNGAADTNSYRYQRVPELLKTYDDTWVKYFRRKDSWANQP